MSDTPLWLHYALEEVGVVEPEPDTGHAKVFIPKKPEPKPWKPTPGDTEPPF